MSWSTFITLESVVIGFVAALFFCLGQAFLTRDAIRELMGTYWNENPHLAAFLRATKAEYFCGGIALCITFTLQFLAIIPGLLPEKAFFSTTLGGIMGALVAGMVAGGLLLLLRRCLVARFGAAASA